MMSQPYLQLCTYYFCLFLFLSLLRQLESEVWYLCEHFYTHGFLHADDICTLASSISTLKWQFVEDESGEVRRDSYFGSVDSVHVSVVEMEKVLATVREVNFVK